MRHPSDSISQGSIPGRGIANSIWINTLVQTKAPVYEKILYKIKRCRSMTSLPEIWE